MTLVEVSDFHCPFCCAQDQGKFWGYHDVLFAHAPEALPERLRRFAEQVGLDVTKFESCLSAGAHGTAVHWDPDEEIQLGVTSTLAFFINGRHEPSLSRRSCA